MPYIVVKANESVLSRVSPNALLSWVDLGVSRATDYRYAVTFETLYGASKCADMQGGEAAHTTDVARGDGAACGVGAGGIDSGLVEVE